MCLYFYLFILHIRGTNDTAFVSSMMNFVESSCVSSKNFQKIEANAAYNMGSFSLDYSKMHKMTAFYGQFIITHSN